MAEKDEGTKTRERVIIHRGPRGRQASGDDAAHIRQLEDEAHRYRRQLREFRDEVAALKGKLPAEGAVVLTADQAKLWKIVVDRKIDTPEKLTAALDAEAKLTEAASATELEKNVDAAAAAFSFPSSTLRDMVTARKLKLELRDVVSVVDEGGKRVRKTEKVWHLGTGKDGESPLAVGDYIEQHTDLGELLGSVEAGEGTDAKGAGTTTATPAAVRRVVTQSSGGSSRAKGSGTVSPAVQRTLDRNRARSQAPSPIRAPKPVTEAGTRAATNGKE